MTVANRERVTQVQWFRAEEELLAGLRPGVPFSARASFQAFGERQFGGLFAGVACCCELPREAPPRWEAALELRKEEIPSPASDTHLEEMLALERRGCVADPGSARSWEADRTVV